MRYLIKTMDLDDMRWLVRCLVVVGLFYSVDCNWQQGRDLKTQQARIWDAELEIQELRTQVQAVRDQARTDPPKVTANVSPTYGSAANTVTQGNDSRLSDSRTPTGDRLVWTDCMYRGPLPCCVQFSDGCLLTVVR